MKIERADAATAGVLGIFGAVQLSDINQIVSILVGLATLVALGFRIRGMTKERHYEEDDSE